MARAAEFPDLPVRRQFAFSLGAWQSPAARAQLARLAPRAAKEPELKVALQASLPAGDPLLAELAASAELPSGSAPLPEPTSAARAEVIAKYRRAGELTGDPRRGREVFRAHCAECHATNGQRAPIGPDLGRSAKRPLDWWVMETFDPSASVEARYRRTRVKTRQGAETIGVVLGESARAVTLAVPKHGEVTILREDIASFQALGPSLMAEGLESVLAMQDFADLLAWIRAGSP
jgi:putative heme-binding domain-containing protein